jgi:tRNA uridine 5-carboxymethylaminomethyl modification enzyme
MFTSRAEYRLMLREDNADMRLTETGRRLGLVDDQRWAAFEHKREAVEQEQQRLRDVWIGPHSHSAAEQQQLLGTTLSREYRAMELLKRPEVTYRTLMELPGIGPGVDNDNVAEQVEIQAKYAGYIDRQRDEIDRQRRHEDTRLPDALDYDQVKGLSSEVRQKLMAARPETLGQAARIPGVTPAAVSLLLVHLKKSDRKQQLKDSA